MERHDQGLKKELARDIELAFPDYSENAPPLELFVDASMKGMGACLGQRQDDFRIIAYASQSFNAAQRNYSVIERELAAMRFGVKTFKAFLYGQVLMHF